MSSLMKSCEQQYSVLTADITAKIGRLKICNDDSRDQLSKDIQTHFDEANELLEQLELAAAGEGVTSRVGAYRAELQRIKDDYRGALSINTAYAVEDELEEWSAATERRQLLAERAVTEDRLERGLRAGARAAAEAERCGAAVLRDLASQRETIQRSRGRLRETDANLSRSSRLAGSLLGRALRERVLLAAACALLAAAACAGLYYAVAQ